MIFESNRKKMVAKVGTLKALLLDNDKNNVIVGKVLSYFSV